MEFEDAKTFFERQKVVDRAVAKLLNEKHLKKRVVSTEKGTATPFKVGDLAWYQCPPTVVTSFQADGYDLPK